MAPALAAGNTAVLKPSEHASVTCLELAAIAHAVGLPPGVLNVVTGLGSEAGAPLSSHPGIAKVPPPPGCRSPPCRRMHAHVDNVTIRCIQPTDQSAPVLFVLALDLKILAEDMPSVQAGVSASLVDYSTPCCPLTMRSTTSASFQRSNSTCPQVAFTGSVDTGRRVNIAAAANLRPTSMELGGKSAMLVFGDVDIDKVRRLPPAPFHVFVRRQACLERLRWWCAASPLPACAFCSTAVSETAVCFSACCAQLGCHFLLHRPCPKIFGRIPQHRQAGSIPHGAAPAAPTGGRVVPVQHLLD